MINQINAAKVKIRAHMNDITDAISIRRLASWDDYNYQTGRINGLAMAEAFINEVIKASQEEEEST